MKAISGRKTIEGEINVLRTRRRNLEKKIADLSRKIKEKGIIDYSYALGEYVEINKSLRETKIKEAELVYIRNII